METENAHLHLSAASCAERPTLVEKGGLGAGDAFSGGLIYGLLTGMSCQETVEFAAAASCLKHSIHGDFNHVSKVEVEALLAGAGSGRIQR